MVSGVFSIPLSGEGLVARGPALVLREFIGGEENQLVCVLMPALERSNHTFQPLLMYGPTGSGKTMLALALAQRFKLLHPHAKTMFLSGADFARMYADAVETGSLADLRGRFGPLSLLVLDDVHHLAEKSGAQQELRRLLDALADRQTRVIITCRPAPAEVAAFSPDLQSRLSAGLVVPLAWPGWAARRELVNRFFASRGDELPAAALDRLAEEITGPASRLLGTLTELVHAADVAGRRLNERSLAQWLDERSEATHITPQAIISAVAKRFRLKVSDLKGPSRRQSISEARGVAMYLIRQLTRQSFQNIGKPFGGRDHTTVMHACEKTEERLAADSTLRQAVDELTSHLRGG